jgi:predicted ATP-grasp superfamily ATP-dependent carboligase
MADSAQVRKPLRVLVSEGNSTSSREAITILGLSGHIVEVCDPSPYCLARFSRFVRKFHRCPGMRDDPAGFLGFVEQLLATGHFDVLLPIHEQGFLFARVRQRLEDRVGLALPSFESYRTAHSKAGFSRLLDQLGLPQPATRIVKSASELRAAVSFPSVVKTSVGTASRGIWFVRNERDLEAALQAVSAQDPSANGAFADEVLVQELVAGTTEKAQGVLDFMPFGKPPPVPAVVRRSSKALAGRGCARCSRPLENNSPGMAHCRSTTLCLTTAPTRS